MRDDGLRAMARLRRWAPLLPLVVGTAILARLAIAGVLAKVGHPAASLDDAYIHFQYARAFAEGHPFRFQAGEPISTGATSFAWPIVLAVPYVLGMKGNAILWAAWAISFVALAALAWEAYALTRPLAGRAAAYGAGAMCLFFGGFVWCAASGMEVVPFAWLIARGAREAAEWVEEPSRRTTRGLRTLFAIALAAPLVRPEGALTSLVLALAVVLFPRAGARPLAGRAPALALLATMVVPNAITWLLTGHASSSTAQVKLLWGNPYYSLVDASLANARTLVTTILNGEVWSAEFLPKGGAPLACAGLAAIAWRGWASGRAFRAIVILLLALSMFVPCTYVTFLWNRLRYLWPFATGWFIGLACLGRAAGAIVSTVDRRAGALTTALVAGTFVGTLVVRLDWVLEDASQSASGIDRQQVALGKWADANLPRDARIGVNDTGAIAYFGNRRTFDVVGLTTASEGRYWVAGAASRVEHYERMHASSPQLLPTHFIVYPEWMQCDPILGRALYEAVVTDATILGGSTMRVYEARWEHLGSGERPWTKLASVRDELDVADVESEAAHRYELLGARDGENAIEEANSPDGAVILDGGRTNRTRDRFTVTLGTTPCRALARVKTSDPAELVLRVDGKDVGKVPVADGTWTELEWPLPARASSGPVTIELETNGPLFTSYHYWFGE